MAAILEQSAQTMKKEDNHNEQALPRHVQDAIGQIASIHQSHHADARFSERLTDTMAALIGTPTALFLLVFIAAVWMTANLAASGDAFDAAPFAILELSSSLSAVFLAVLILAAQRRDDRLANRREQMTLQASLLAEQKVSKLIELVEELRRDMPNVDNRIDPDAIDMKSSADHQVALKSVEEKSRKSS